MHTQTRNNILGLYISKNTHTHTHTYKRTYVCARSQTGPSLLYLPRCPGAPCRYIAVAGGSDDLDLDIDLDLGFDPEGSDVDLDESDDDAFGGGMPTRHVSIMDI